MEYIQSCLKDDDRFYSIIDTYLSSLTNQDLLYLTQDDLISLVPIDNHRDRLLMIILVKRYLKLLKC
jgi:hypothetical protein